MRTNYRNPVVEDATEAAGMTAESVGRQILTMQELAKGLNVSTKTISRWRKLGLVSRRFLSQGRLRVGFLESSVEQFVAANSERVRRGSEFSQLTEQERQTIVQQARELARGGCWLSEVTKRLARLTGRNVETIRYTLKHHDQQNPASAIFPDHHGPLRLETRQKVYQLYRRGDSIESLSKRFCRTKASIQRIVMQMRAQRILELPLDYVPSGEFAEGLAPKADREMLAPMPNPEEPNKKIRFPKGLPPYLASLYEVPLLAREQEAHLFRRMNYLKYKAAQLRSTLNPQRPRNRLMDRIERLYNEAVTTKNQILRANLRLVVSIAKRHVGPTVNFFELVSDGNISLIRAVEKFDYSRGNKFSTYASWALMKNYARSIPGELRHIDRFRTGQGDVFVSTQDVRSDQQEQEAEQTQREAQIERILSRLGRREQEIIVSRFGLSRDQEPQTLQQVGVGLGVTKERIRQLEARALRKLRVAAEEENIAFSV
jgi:RNA polymerase primary sigma factor/RNA polymerase sigma factor